MTTKATAVQTPPLASTGDTYALNRSLRLTASLATVVKNRIRNDSTPTPPAIVATRMRVVSDSAMPAAKPAGIQATAIRRTGCAPWFASSCSGSAPRMCGPTFSACELRSRYSHPTPPQTAKTTSSQPSDSSATRRAP